MLLASQPSRERCTTCDAATTNTLATDVSGNLSGSITAPATLTTGSRAIKITEGTNSSLTPIVVLAGPTLTLTPAAGGAGTVVGISGGNWNPITAVSIIGSSFRPDPGAPTDFGGGAVNASGVLAGSITVNNSATAFVFGQQGPSGAPSANNPGTFAPFSFSLFKCTAASGTSTGPATPTNRLRRNGRQPDSIGAHHGCEHSTPRWSTWGDRGAVLDTVLTGDLNTIQVQDNRGGTFGWSLSAMTDFDSGR